MYSVFTTKVNLPPLSNKNVLHYLSYSFNNGFIFIMCHKSDMSDKFIDQIFLYEATHIITGCYHFGFNSHIKHQGCVVANTSECIS